MARILDLESPPPPLLSDWQTTASRVYALHDDPASAV